MPSDKDQRRNTSPLSTGSGASSSSSSSKGRKYFQKVQPTFAIRPSATPLEFVDNSDPTKHLVVRKKAREWVFRNKEGAGQKKRAARSGILDDESREAQDALTFHHYDPGKQTSVPSLHDPSSGRIDPFDILPNVGRKVDHIIEFYHETRQQRIHFLTSSVVLTQCPEEVPFSDDKFAWRSSQSLVPLSRENTVLGTMSSEHVSFVLWLHATTLIRDGMQGNWDSEEALWYYRLALKVMREEAKRNVKDFSDSFLSSLACFSATANFSGQFEAAEMHRDAMIRAVTAKGGGNLMNGLKLCKPWTLKAMVWCEFHVAAQIPAVPKFPYMPPPSPALPYEMVMEMERLTSLTLSHLPPMSEPFSRLVYLIHQLSLSQRHLPSVNLEWPGRNNTDFSATRALYDAEYSLLGLLSTQREPDHSFTQYEVMFSEACQIYLWMAVRGMPPAIKLCDLFAQRLQKALMPIFNNTLIESYDSPQSVDTPSSGSYAHSVGETVAPPTDFAVIWALYLGTLIASIGPRPEYTWFHGHLLRLILIKNSDVFRCRDDFQRILKMFPYTEAFCGLGIARLNIPF